MPVWQERKVRMILRKLEQSEHDRTRRLWEEVFPEDTRAFLDYYYYIKTRDNQIYAVEEDGDICSMLQLNPYKVVVEDKEFSSAYVIAVATRAEYRRRGYMGALLRASLKDMYAQKFPFTFLMPAAEAIYTPYDFRYIYSQDIGSLIRKGTDRMLCWQSTEGKGTEGEGTEETGSGGSCGIQYSDAGLWDAEELAGFFAENFAHEFQVCTVRDSAYYQTMILEQQSERGGVRLVREDDSLKGFYAYAGEEGLEIREPLFLPGYEKEFRQSVRELAEQRGWQDQTEIRVHACPAGFSSEKKPLIMARIVCLGEFLAALKVPEEERVDCSFAVIDPLITENSRVWKVTSSEGETKLHVRETEDSEGVLPIAGLTELLFGRMTPEELETQEGVIMTGHLAGELSKITKLTRVCFNEVV